MSRILDENYYQIGGWMLNCLQLKGTELQVFAILYGFSQDGESVFSGSLSYLEDWVGASRPTIIKALKELVSKNYIIKETHEINGVTFNRYKANLQVIASLRGSKETLQGSKETLHNNNIYNNTNILSKDNILDKGHSQSSSLSATATSGKLFSSAKTQTRKSSEQKTNNFITTCQREAVKKGFSAEVLNELDKYFIMLAEMNCLLPSVSIVEQLAHLAKVSADKQVLVVKNTVSRGWKSLQYEAEAAASGCVPKWDTAAPGSFQAKTEEEKNRDWRTDVPEDRIF